MLLLCIKRRGMSKEDHHMLLPTILTILQMAMATITILTTTMIERGNRTMVVT